MIPKFRARIKSKRKLLPVSQMIWHKGDISRILAVEGAVLDSHLAEDVILMQSTGLFDKNGKEIFEGDVVRMHSGELLPVRLHHGMFEPVCYYISNVFEKVGNVFENPELLEHPDFRGGNQ
ncbi:YopX family protein [Streptococcus suis]